MLFPFLQGFSSFRSNFISLAERYCLSTTLHMRLKRQSMDWCQFTCTHISKSIDLVRLGLDYKTVRYWNPKGDDDPIICWNENLTSEKNSFVDMRCKFQSLLKTRKASLSLLFTPTSVETFRLV